MEFVVSASVGKMRKLLKPFSLILNPKPETLSPKPEKPETLSPKPEKPETLNPKPETLSPKP